MVPVGAKLQDDGTYEDVKEHVLRYVETKGVCVCVPIGVQGGAGGRAGERELGRHRQRLWEG